MINNNQEKKLAAYVLTNQGLVLAEKLVPKMKADLYLPERLADDKSYGFSSLTQVVKDNFFEYTGHIFIMATGIVVRLICPFLSGKDKDPAVVVLDQKGQYVISLISGHLGGGNDLARDVASYIGGQAVITTATDNLDLTSIDLLARDKGLEIGNLRAVKRINSALIAKERIQVFDNQDLLGWQKSCPQQSEIVFVADPADLSPHNPAVVVHFEQNISPVEDNHLLLYPKCLIAGLGCNRETSAEEIIDLINDVFSRYSLSLASLKCLVTTSRKRQEPGLWQAAQEFGVGLEFVSHNLLKDIEVPSPSEMVDKHMGVSSVCEASAMIIAQTGKLLVPKTKSLNATLAVAVRI